MVGLNQAEIEKIVEASTRKAVEDTLTRIGVDISNPLRAQADFLALRELSAMLSDKEFQEDLAYLRRWRLSINNVQSKGAAAMIGIIVTGFAAIVLLGFRKWMGD